MKNRLYWFLLLVLIVFVWLVYLIFRQETKRIENTNQSWALEENKIIFTKIEKEKEKTSNTGKIQEIRDKNTNYAYFNVSGEKFYFNIVWEKLELKHSGDVLWYFDVVLKKDLKVSEILWQEKLFFIEIWEKKYIYSELSWFVKNFETKLEINYSKISLWNFIFYSENKGAFVLYKDKNELEYFSLFNDFIFYKTWYIWVVSGSDTEKKSRFWLKNSKNYILFYDPKTKNQKIVYELNFMPTKIYESDEKIYFENKELEKFSIENY